jgi:hypothetical protein
MQLSEISQEGSPPRSRVDAHPCAACHQIPASQNAWLAIPEVAVRGGPAANGGVAVAGRQMNWAASGVANQSVYLSSCSSRLKRVSRSRSSNVLACQAKYAMHMVPRRMVKGKQLSLRQEETAIFTSRLACRRIRTDCRKMYYSHISKFQFKHSN